MTDSTDRDRPLVAVFRAEDPGALPLATMALKRAGIEHVVRRGEMSSIIVGERSELSSPSPADKSVPEIFVAAEDEAAARDLLADLPSGDVGVDDTASASVTTDNGDHREVKSGPWPSGGGEAVRLVDSTTGAMLAKITEEQLDWLGRHLELESVVDTDYYLTADTLQLLEEAGANPGFIGELRRALGSRDGMDVRWSRE